MLNYAALGALSCLIREMCSFCLLAFFLWAWLNEVGLFSPVFLLFFFSLFLRRLVHAEHWHPTSQGLAPGGLQMAGRECQLSLWRTPTLSQGLASCRCPVPGMPPEPAFPRCCLPLVSEVQLPSAWQSKTQLNPNGLPAVCVLEVCIWYLHHSQLN